MKLESAIEILKERTKDFTTYPSIGLMCKVMEDYAFQQAVEFTDWYRHTAFEKTMYKDTRQLYEQFMLERNSSDPNNKPFAIANVSVSLPAKVYEVTFGVHLAARIKATGSIIEVENAVNGWGDPIPLDEVEVFDRQ